MDAISTQKESPGCDWKFERPSLESADASRKLQGDSIRDDGQLVVDFSATQIGRERYCRGSRIGSSMIGCIGSEACGPGRNNVVPC
jgi:hypothetical protein